MQETVSGEFPYPPETPSKVSVILRKTMSILISACLLGINCKYDGKSNTTPEVIEFVRNRQVLPVCPEVFGGLSIPRTPCEICGKHILSKNGGDFTAEYLRGAEITLRMAQAAGAKFAILKAKSPSCGFGKIYDGTFSHTLAAGNGIAADMLAKSGIVIANEDNFRDIIK